MYFSEQGDVDDDATLIAIFLASFNLQSCCLMKSAVCKCHTPVFRKNTNWTRQSLLAVFLLFLLGFPQEPGRYILATLPGHVNVGIYSTLYIRKRCLHVLIENESFECAATACSWPQHLCGWPIHSCENWFAFGMEVLFWCVLLSLSCFSFVRNYWIQEGDIFLSSLRRGTSKTMAAQSEVEELQLQLESKICSLDLNGLVELAAHIRATFSGDRVKSKNRGTWWKKCLSSYFVQKYLIVSQ